MYLAKVSVYIILSVFMASSLPESAALALDNWGVLAVKQTLNAVVARRFDNAMKGRTLPFSCANWSQLTLGQAHYFFFEKIGLFIKKIWNQKLSTKRNLVMVIVEKV